MRHSLESTRARPVPRDLALRLAIGQALEILELQLVTNEISPQDAKTLLKAADLLRPTAGSPAEMGTSLGDSRDDLELISAASFALKPERMRSLFDLLENDADHLRALAAGKKLSVNTLEQLTTHLTSIHEAISLARGIDAEHTIRSAQ